MPGLHSARQCDRCGAFDEYGEWPDVPNYRDRSVAVASTLPPLGESKRAARRDSLFRRDVGYFLLLLVFGFAAVLARLPFPGRR